MPAFLGGSHVNGTAEEYFDLYLVTTDEAHEAFLSGREAFIRLMGEPPFLEDLGTLHAFYFMFSDDTECELWFGCEDHFNHIHAGSYRDLHDKKGILVNAVFPRHEADQTEQMVTLRQQVTWFWHDLSRLINTMGHGQHWFAYGQLEAIRHMCVNLTRLRYNFSDGEVGEEPYFKVEHMSPL